MTFRRVILPMSIPAVVAGSIFTFALTLGDYIVPGSRLDDAVHRQRHRHQRGPGSAVRGRVLARAPGDHPRLPAHRQAPRRLRGILMPAARSARLGCGSRRRSFSCSSTCRSRSSSSTRSTRAGPRPGHRPASPSQWVARRHREHGSAAGVPDVARRRTGRHARRDGPRQPSRLWPSRAIRSSGERPSRSS